MHHPENEAEERKFLHILFALTAVAFWPTLLSLPETWSRTSQDHGIFAAGLAAWVVWQNRERVRRTSDSRLGALLPVAGAISFAWLFVVIMNVTVLQQLFFMLALVTWALITFGWRARVPVLTAAAVFSLGLPIWEFVIPVLRRATTIMSGAMARLVGVSSVIRDDTITIASGTFLVESGCSGINYFLAGLTLGAFYGILFTPRWTTQLKIVAVAGAMAMVGNWIRVAALVVLGEMTQMQSPLIEDHLWQGWLIFTLLMVPTYLLAHRIERRDRGREALSAPLASDPPSASFDPTRPKRAGLASACLVVGPLLFTTGTLLPARQDLDRALRLPEAAALGTLSSWDPAAPSWTPALHGVDDQISWSLPDTEPAVELSRYFFVDQRQGEELIQWNNAIAPDSLLVVERVRGPVGPNRRLVREAIFHTADGPRIAWYWYRVGGVDTPFPSKAKLAEIVAFFRRSAVAELVTLSAPCAPDQCEAAARALLTSLTGQGGQTASSGDSP